MKDLKTTITGLVAGVPLAAQALLTAFEQGAFTGKTGLQLLAAIGLILLGLWSSDKKKPIVATAPVQDATAPVEGA